MKSMAYGRKSVIERSVSEILDMERKLPNYWFDFKFDPLPKDKQDQYDALVSKYKALAEVEETEKEIQDKKGRYLANLIASLEVGLVCPTCAKRKINTLVQPTMEEIASMCANEEKGLPAPFTSTLTRYVQRETDTNPITIRSFNRLQFADRHPTNIT